MGKQSSENMDFVNFERSDHFAQRALQRFCIEKSVLSRWTTNILSNGTKQKCVSNSKGTIYSVVYHEVKIIVSPSNRTIVTCYPVNNIQSLSKLAEKGKENEATKMAVDAINQGIQSVVRKKNRKIREIINAIKDMEDIHVKTTRVDYYVKQEKQIDDMYNVLDKEMTEKHTISDVLQNIHIY